MAKLELSRELSLSAEQAWQHASNLSELGAWLVMYEGWRSELPTELTLGTTVVGVARAKGLRNRVTWTVHVTETSRSCAFAVRLDLGGRPLFGPIGAVVARVVKGDIERSIQRFEDQYG